MELEFKFWIMLLSFSVKVFHQSPLFSWLSWNVFACIGKWFLVSSCLLPIPYGIQCIFSTIEFYLFSDVFLDVSSTLLRVYSSNIYMLCQILFQNYLACNKILDSWFLNISSILQGVHGADLTGEVGLDWPFDWWWFNAQPWKALFPNVLNWK